MKEPLKNVYERCICEPVSVSDPQNTLKKIQHQRAKIPEDRYVFRIN